MDDQNNITMNEATTTAAANSTTNTNVMIIEWEDLVLINRQDHEENDQHKQQHRQKKKEDVQRLIQEAIHTSYNATNGIGILAIHGVPNFVAYKDQFLPQAHTLATIVSNDYKETYLTDPTSLYNTGWSFGKEQLGRNKPIDTCKGSYYYNPITDTPGTEHDRQQYPLSYPCNKWPSSDIQQSLLPEFEQHAKQMGLLLTQVAIEFSKQLDLYVQTALRQQVQLQVQQQQIQQTTSSSSLSTTTVPSIYELLKDTDKVKARLLYYYPPPPPTTATTITTTTNAEDSWIGWHNDSGFLTALAGDMYVHHRTGARITNIDTTTTSAADTTTTTDDPSTTSTIHTDNGNHDCIDPNAGLYVLNRSATAAAVRTATSGPAQQVIKVEIPYDCCAIQIGECVQIITGGILCATPHCVRGCSSSTNKYQNVARISLPCFIDTHPSYPLQAPNGISREQVLLTDQTNTKVPPLGQRWKSKTCTNINETNITTSTDTNIDTDSSTNTLSSSSAMTFGEFLKETFEMYYGWETPSTS